MSEANSSEDNLVDEFHKLGENLMNTVRAAWERPERKKLQEEIESGLAELATTIKSEADTFRESPTGQRLKSDLDEFGQRVRSGEVEKQLRQDLLDALRVANTELQRVINRVSASDIEPDSTGADIADETVKSKGE